MSEPDPSRTARGDRTSIDARAEAEAFAWLDDQLGATPPPPASPPPASPASTVIPAAESAPSATSPHPTPTGRRGRISKWDRPPEPKDWRWWIGNLGKTLIAAGLLMFAFVAYQLWGTGIETARAQDRLENEFDALLAEAQPVTAPPISVEESTPESTPLSDGRTADPSTTDPVTDEPATSDPAVSDSNATPTATPAPVPVAAQNLPALENGDAVARIEIPAIGVNDIVVAGVSPNDLKKGPGHYPDTPLPGQLGNAAIAGHRTTYGQPFFDVDKLVVGDEIVVTTLNGRYTYRVTGQEIVSPSDYQVVATVDASRATLTLTSCHPRYTARQRIVIFSDLVAETSAPVGEPVINYGRPDTPSDPDSDAPIAVDDPTIDDPTDDPAIDDPMDEATIDDPTDEALSGTTEPVVGAIDDGSSLSGLDAPGSSSVNEDIADVFGDGWFSDPGANLQVGLWGLLLGFIGIGAYLVSRRLRRDWAGLLVGVVPFVATTYFFFQNVIRLLPPNL